MKIITAHLKSASPYSQSRAHDEPKLDREIPKDYEARTWKNRLHLDGKGRVIIPPMAIKNALSEAAKFMSISIPGKGKATYTKHFEAGVTVASPIELGLTADDIEGEWLFLNSDGKRGGGTRVWKCYPLIREWEGVAEIFILDDIITRDVFLQVLEGAGMFIGLGRFRPRNNGFYGRFAVEALDWE